MNLINSSLRSTKGGGALVVMGGLFCPSISNMLFKILNNFLNGYTDRNTRKVAKH